MNTVTSAIDPRMLQRRLVAAFLAIPKHLPCRPEPRHVFDNVARKDNPLPPRGADLIALYKSAMAAAIATNDLRVIEKTQALIVEFHDELLSQGLSDSPIRSTVSIPELACRAMKETAEALTAIGRAGMDPSHTDVAVRESGEAMVVLAHYRERAAGIPQTTRGNYSQASSHPTSRSAVLGRRPVVTR